MQSFVVTTNMPPQADFDLGPMIDAHAAHPSAYRVEHLELTPRRVRTLDDVIASQKRMRKLEAAYRQEMEIPSPRTS